MSSIVKGAKVRFILDEINDTQGLKGLDQLIILYKKPIHIQTHVIFSEIDYVSFASAASEVLYHASSGQELFKLGWAMGRRIFNTPLIALITKIIEIKKRENHFSDDKLKNIESAMKLYNPDLNVKAYNVENVNLAIEINDTIIPPELWHGELSYYLEGLKWPSIIEKEIISDSSYRFLYKNKK